MTAHTLVCGQTSESSPVSGRVADVMLAAHNAMEAATRLVKAGNTNEQVTTAIAKIAEDFALCEKPRRSRCLRTRQP